MSLRAQYRTYLRAVWTDTPAAGPPVAGARAGEFRIGGRAPARPFAIVTAAAPRGRGLDPAADRVANERLGLRIRGEGYHPLPCVGRDPDGTHAEESFWIWDVPAAVAVGWGRAFDQRAVVAGDGRRAGLLPCFPEAEPDTAPDSVLLLHGLGGSGVGSVRLLEEALRARGWSETRFQRPTLMRVRERRNGDSVERLVEEAADELAAWSASLALEPPILVVGLSAGGLVAASSAAPWRIGVASPWGAFDGATLDRLCSWPGFSAVHGARDEVVPCEAHLGRLPPSVGRTVDPSGSHDFDAWRDRIADAVVAHWKGRELSRRSR